MNDRRSKARPPNASGSPRAEANSKLGRTRGGASGTDPRR